MNLLYPMAFALGCAAIIDDLRRRAIANWITLPAIAGAFCFHLWQAGLRGLGLWAAGTAVGFTVFLIFYLFGAMGAGDIKLMAAFGALLGPTGILLAALFAAPIGALLAAVWLVAKRSTRAIPYAPAIAAGAWLALLGRG